MERLKEEARMHGFVRTPFGRKLWIADIATKDPVRRAGAERAAINAPFQGGAAEIIKRAMVRLPRALHQAGLLTREKRSTWAYYAVVPESLAALALVLTPGQPAAAETTAGNTLGAGVVATGCSPAARQGEQPTPA